MTSPSIAVIPVVLVSVLSVACPAVSEIDREAIVMRHTLHLTTPGKVQVGNGEFAFTADLTGLQTLEECCTMSQWGWHTSPLPSGLTQANFRWTPRKTYSGRTVDYMIGEGDAISKWLYANPHKLNLGRIGLHFRKQDGSSLRGADLVDLHQTLDLWNGVLTTQFQLEGQSVKVTTCCHPSLDAVAVRIESSLLTSRRLGVELAFPYPDPNEFGGYGVWDRPEAHRTEMKRRAGTCAEFMRVLDATRYWVTAAWNVGCAIEAGREPHHYVLSSDRNEIMELVCAFSKEPLPALLPGVGEALAKTKDYWNDFWRNGGAVDLSESADPRWWELERRMVLSQYLTAVNCAGSLPPQESGLVNNGWNGKFHMEMYWWHGAHFALWNRWSLLERSLGVYRTFLPVARETAARQGYKGARWPKCTGPEGRESPHPIHAMLIWQQPHPIFFAELDYRAHGNKDTLEKWADIVSDTADFMASFAVFEENANRYVLGYPIYTVPETTNPDTVYNPTFELAYWRFGLETAQKWRERLGEARKPEWDKVLDALAPFPVQEGIYLMEENLPDSYTKWNHNHPSVAGILGILPGRGVEIETMRRTFGKILSSWRWEETWGWDFPMLAMTAARLCEPEKAVELLLHPNFAFDERGYPVEGGPWPYLPSSGGYLYALGMMAAGWDGSPERPGPGFPDNGRWKVKIEKMSPAP